MSKALLLQGFGEQSMNVWLVWPGHARAESSLLAGALAKVGPEQVCGAQPALEAMVRKVKTN